MLRLHDSSARLYGSSVRATAFPMSGSVAAPRGFTRDSSIYRAGGHVGQLYRVLDGAVRTCRLLLDGRRQIDGFYLPGETFGLATGETHDFSAEAIIDSAILTAGNLTLDCASGHAPSPATLALMRQELRRTQDHVLLLAMDGLERVAGFLLEMTERFHSSDPLELPMSRQDIGDYLGLTVETVGRLLTQLERESAITIITSRRIVLRRPAALWRLAGRLPER